MNLKFTKPQKAALRKLLRKWAAHEAQVHENYMESDKANGPYAAHYGGVSCGMINCIADLETC